MVGLLVVAGVGAGLMAASPVRPAQPMAEVASGTGDQRREQVLDLVPVNPISPDGGGIDQASRLPGRLKGAT